VATNVHKMLTEQWIYP